MLNFKVTSIKTMPRSPQTEAMVQQHMAAKVATQNRNTTLSTNAINESQLSSLRAEYDEFIKNMANMDFGEMFFKPKDEEKKEDVLPEAVQEEAYNAFVKEADKGADLVNGISVGEEAGDAVVIASTTKKTSRKKKTDDSTETA